MKKLTITKFMEGKRPSDIYRKLGVSRACLRDWMISGKNIIVKVWADGSFEVEQTRTLASFGREGK